MNDAINAGTELPFQGRVRPWLLSCFGPVIPFDKTERNHRFLEEAIELVQSLGCTRSEAHQLVDYVYGRPEGEPNQEVGGVMVTLAALCLANNLDMAASGETELARIWTKVEKIRAKQAAKPKHSPLPEAPASTPKATVEREAIADLVRMFVGTEVSQVACGTRYKTKALDALIDAILARLDEAAIRADEREKLLNWVCERLLVLADGWKANPSKDKCGADIALINAAVAICGRGRIAAIRGGK